MLMILQRSYKLRLVGGAWILWNTLYKVNLQFAKNRYHLAYYNWNWKNV